MTNKTYILDDLPAERDALDFQPYIDTLADVISSPDTQTPLTIGIFGGWGSGKTTLMGQVQDKLDDKGIKSLWINVWQLSSRKELWNAFLQTLFNQVDERMPWLRRWVFKWHLFWRRVRWGELLKALLVNSYRIVVAATPILLATLWPDDNLQTASDLLRFVLDPVTGGVASVVLATWLVIAPAIEATKEKVSIDLEVILKESPYQIQITELQQLQEQFECLVKTWVFDRGRLVVFIDDLDRCIHDKIPDVLEAIKLFANTPRCIYVLGLDHEIVKKGIKAKYNFKEGEEVEYLEKVVQIPFQLPPIAQEDMRSFVEGLVTEWEHEECPRVFAAGLGGNPRRVKRTVNTFLLLNRLAEKRQGDIKAVRLAKVVAIQNAFPRLYEFLKEDRHRYLRELEIYFLARPNEPIGRDVQDVDEITESSQDSYTAEIQKALYGEPVELPPALTPFLRQRGIAAVRRVLTLHPDKPEYNFSELPPDDLRVYFTLTRRAEAPQKEAKPGDLPLTAFEPQLVTIPAGSFLMGTTEERARQLIVEGMKERFVKREVPQHTVKLSEYQISKYPITNQEYQTFIQDSDHRPPQKWDGDQYPEGKGDHPVVYVSWDDVAAYCQWLSEKTSKPYSLPTEAEWEKAARGEDGRIYPWGDEWDVEKCNSGENKINDTTPIGQYSPQGDSPHGCADMVGNVWEWCVDLFDEKRYKHQLEARENVINPQELEHGDNDRHVSRGGAFSNKLMVMRCTYRSWQHQSIGKDNLGFRVISSGS